MSTNNDYEAPVGVLDDLNATLGLRKIFDCGNEGFISRFELMIAWMYINDLEFYETADPKFHLQDGLQEITDEVFSLREMIGGVALDFAVKDLTMKYKDKVWMVDEINRLADLIRAMEPTEEDIETFKEEYPYWEKFVFLLKMKRDLEGLMDFDGAKIVRTVNNFKNDSYYV